MNLGTPNGKILKELERIFDRIKLKVIREIRIEHILIYGIIGLIFVAFLCRLIEFYQLFEALVSMAMLMATTYLVRTSLISAQASREEANSAKEQTEAIKLQIKATKESIKASVAPNIIFRIRPANHYWNGPFGRQPSDWKSGVGIYLENVGLGHALRVKLFYRAVGEKDEHICKADFSKLRAGIPYTLPSKDHPELEVKGTHTQIIIDSIEYDDIRTPPNHYRIDEPEILEINSAFFEEPDKL